MQALTYNPERYSTTSDVPGTKFKTTLHVMNAVVTPPPATIDQVKQLPHEYARTHAGAVVIVSAKLPAEHGPITSKKLFMEGNKLVYEFYRARNKDNKFYIIF